MSIAIDCEFPGGNIVVEKIDGDCVRLHQDLRDTDGDWFYWSFRVRGAQSRSVTFEFTRGNPIGTRGPCISTDGGESWQWLGSDAVREGSFRYSFGANATEVCFAFGIPYLESHLRAFLARHRDSSFLIGGELCRSATGRRIELLRAGRLDGNCRHRIMLTARHHACEAVANYALEGLLDTVLSSDALGQWYREHVEILAVPFMDKDGVEAGDQGKNRKPYDHNRDYAGDLYPSVCALRRLVPDWSGGKLRAALDLHCPWIRGRRNETIYCVGTASKGFWREINRFGALLENQRRGVLPYSGADNLPFGVDWNTYDGPQVTFQRWAQTLPGVQLSTTLEIPYANVGAITVSAAAVREFGRDLARALQQYLTTNA